MRVRLFRRLRHSGHSYGKLSSTSSKFDIFTLENDSRDQLLTQLTRIIFLVDAIFAGMGAFSGSRSSGQNFGQPMQTA